MQDTYLTTTFTLAVLGCIVVLLVIWYWLFKRPAKGPLPEYKESWRKLLEENVGYYHNLIPADKERFDERMRRFFQQVQITGIQCELTELDRVLVAASGIIPTFGFKQWNQYPRLNEVIVYKDHFERGTFRTEGLGRDVAGMVGGGYLNGKLLLSRPSLRQGFQNPGRGNTGIHEFAHLLDKADGDTDGIPQYFLDNAYVVPWLEMIRAEAEAIERGNSDIDDYALTNKAEFFAVVSEYFFNRPAAFAEKHPELFALLERVFHQDLDGDGGIGTVEGEEVIDV